MKLKERQYILISETLANVAVAWLAVGVIGQLLSSKLDLSLLVISVLLFAGFFGLAIAIIK